MVYTWGTSGRYTGPVARYTRDLAPAPLAETGKHTYGSLYGRAGRGCPVCGMDVDPGGRVYATWGANECHVRVYDAAGKLAPADRVVTVKQGGKTEQVPALITGVSGYGGSIRVDRAGNVYLVQQGLPKGFKPPRGFEKDEGFRHAAASILKFGPAGGERTKGDDAVLGFRGVLRVYPGCGPISRWRCIGACACTKPRFDVDGYGRLFIPNALAFCVSVRDNAGNEIVRFGRYGNFDAQREIGGRDTGSRKGGERRGSVSRPPISRPEIPLGWPVAVGAGERHVYVGDCLNHRVIRVDKTYAAEARCEIGE
jgi:hypothetical protein